MTILVINNYYDETDFWKAQGIVDRLKGLGRDGCKILHFTRISEKAITSSFEAIILSGSPGNLSEEDLPKFKAEIDLVKRSDVPVLGICFGHQLIAKAFGSKIRFGKKVKGFKKARITEKDEIFVSWKVNDEISLCQNHREYVASIPADFMNLAESKDCKMEAMKHKSRPIYGVQAHIERANGKNPDGLKILQNFLFNVVEKVKAKQTISHSEEEELKNEVEDSEQKYGIADCVYDNCIQGFSNLSLNKLRKEDEIRIFRPFLLTWGAMGRVLGYVGVVAVFSEVQSLGHKIEPLRKECLLTINLFDFRNAIVELFNRLGETRFKSEKGRTKRAGSTASSKILHLACPDLFVMWDSEIRERYGKSKGDGKEYFEFLLTMQTFMLRLEATINSLKEKYGKKPTRIVDQFNWMKTH